MWHTPPENQSCMHIRSFLTTLQTVPLDICVSMQRVVWAFKHPVINDMKAFKSSRVNTEFLGWRPHPQYSKFNVWTSSALLPAKYSPCYSGRRVHISAPGGVPLCARVSGDGDGSPKTKESTKREEAKPFSSIPGPKPLPFLGNMLLFTALGELVPIPHYNGKT